MITILTGKQGTGKSFLTKKLIINNTVPKIIFDIRNEYSGKLYKNIHDFYTAIMKKEFPIRIALKNDADIEKAFYLISGIENVTIVIDEFYYYLDQYSKRSSLFEAIRFSRHTNQNYFIISQRISDIPGTIISQASYIYTFRQTDLKDLKILALYEFNYEIVKNLPNYQYIAIKK
jgi:AAA+ ATPase superfamily predicted ATPase